MTHACKQDTMSIPPDYVKCGDHGQMCTIKQNTDVYQCLTTLSVLIIQVSERLILNFKEELIK